MLFGFNLEIFISIVIQQANEKSIRSYKFEDQKFQANKKSVHIYKPKKKCQKYEEC